MAFLDNGGDIILDAVLTDAGRERLARGDGSFDCKYFALGDDEINYQLYQNNNHPDGANPSGSAYYDLEILQTPILEAFTNGSSLMKSKLISIANTNKLYLPVIKKNNQDSSDDSNDFSDGAGVSGVYIITVDEATTGVSDALLKVGNIQAFKNTAEDYGRSKTPNSGVISGWGIDANPNNIVVHQGLDTSDIPTSQQLDLGLTENTFIIEMDDRFGKLAHPRTLSEQTPSFVDSASTATYYVYYGGGTTGTTSAARAGAGFITRLLPNDSSMLAGPRAVRLSFKVKSSLALATSVDLMEKTGGTYVYQGRTFYYVDSIIRITGATTGYRIDIPVRYVKFKSN